MQTSRTEQSYDRLERAQRDFIGSLKGNVHQWNYYHEGVSSAAAEYISECLKYIGEEQAVQVDQVVVDIAEDGIEENALSKGLNLNLTTVVKK